MRVPPSELNPFFQTHLYVVTITASASKILSASPNRISLLIGSSNTAGTWIWPDGSLTGVAKGILIAQNALPLLLKYSDLGGTLTGEWWALGGGAGFNVSIIETIFGQSIELAPTE